MNAPQSRQGEEATPETAPTEAKSGASGETGNAKPVLKVPRRAAIETVDRGLELEQHLSRPYPQPTLFYLVDKIERFTRGAAGDEAGAIDAKTLMAQSARQDQNTLEITQTMLERCVQSGVLEQAGEGPEARYRLSEPGRRNLVRSKAMRLALWRINPEMSIAEICAIVQIEGNDALTEMLTRHAEKQGRGAAQGQPGQGQDQDSQGKPPKKPGRAQRERQVRGQKDRGPAPPHPLWAGLLRPCRNDDRATNPL